MIDYKELKPGHFSGFSAGIINNQYVISVPMGICDVPEYYPISSDEFDTFLTWQETLKFCTKLSPENLLNSYKEYE